jgi:hypothetical protein
LAGGANGITRTYRTEASIDVNPPAAIVPSNRVLLVSDWSTDPDAVITACRERAAAGDVAFALVVPAWLHGLDWVGDPTASRPCAARQLDTLTRLAASAGLDVRFADVGDPDPSSEVDDALQHFAATEVLLCRDTWRLGHPIDLSRRLRRMTGLPVAARPTRSRRDNRERRRWRALLDGGHCLAEPSHTQ